MIKFDLFKHFMNYLNFLYIYTSYVAMKTIRSETMRILQHNVVMQFTYDTVCTIK